MCEKWNANVQLLLLMYSFNFYPFLFGHQQQSKSFALRTILHNQYVLLPMAFVAAPMVEVGYWN